jgi:general secretion pathway protein G
MNGSDNGLKTSWRVSPLFVIAAIILTFLIVGAISSGIQAERKSARNRMAVIRIGTLGNALERFKSDNGYYPASSNGLNDLVVKPPGATNWHREYQIYIERIPLDPWGHAYLYEYPGKHGTNAYDISSAGPDGKFGTEDDIANW